MLREYNILDCFGSYKTIIVEFDYFWSNKKQLSLSLIALLPFGTIIVAANLETVPQFVCLVQKQKTARDPCSDTIHFRCCST